MTKIGELRGKSRVTFIYCNCQKNWLADKSLSGPKNAANRRRYIAEHALHDLVSWSQWTWRKYATNESHPIKKSEGT